MRIGELAKRSGVSVRSLRYYEEQRLLHPTRMPSGYRVYEDTDVVHVQRIQALLTAGLSTRKLERILPCMRQHDAGLALSCGDLYDELITERAELLARIDALRASVTALDAVIEASPRPVSV
ncbi:MerR family transcriptional regulator [Agromyces archimandritae]|uniref:MerR family transcriptional regulator n=1 Tax=Agromyces archimandritae TaxID=2781962 RepID=A0A975FQB6_9MICO|nr:MerR family transcriptional regulator [Agromyces archimandritae]QTX06044.1 MerR family transcriptional regulator [Agromyces archimandritae]